MSTMRETGDRTRFLMALMLMVVGVGTLSHPPVSIDWEPGDAYSYARAPALSETPVTLAHPGASWMVGVEVEGISGPRSPRRAHAVGVVDEVPEAWRPVLPPTVRVAPRPASASLLGLPTSPANAPPAV